MRSGFSQRADQLQRARRVLAGRPSGGCRAAAAGSGTTARTLGEQVVALEAVRELGVARLVVARCSSATASQKPSSPIVPSRTRIALRKRKKQSTTSVRIDSAFSSSGTSARIRSTVGGSSRSRVHQHDLLGDVLEQDAPRHVVLEHEDEVLAVRHEHEVVGVEAVQQRRAGRRRGSGAATPRRSSARALDQRGRQRAAVAVDVQQRGHRREPLARARAAAPGSRATARRASSGTGRLGLRLVVLAAVADGRALAQDLEARRGQHSSPATSSGDPVVDRRRALHVGGRQPAHEAHVDHRQRGLDVVALPGSETLKNVRIDCCGEVLVVAVRRGTRAAAGRRRPRTSPRAASTTATGAPGSGR